MVKNTNQLVRLGTWVWSIFLICAACAPLIGPYSPTAYENATSLKASTLSLMSRATETFAGRQKEVEALLVDIDKAYEYVNGIPSNSISAKQWDILRKPDGDLIGKFVLRWKEKQAFNPVWIAEMKGQVADAFDEIICLEANKKEATRCRKAEGK